ncbi:MAG TPA: thiamine-monophosphate kinase, partial [Candidatus Omnitrophica bacterium]|nr:thiamine-monophosphate kinase [Candidatus Omnitrophota bacterium]
MLSGRVSELDLIQRISRGIKNSPSVVHGIGDDTAVLKYTRDKYQLFTCDMLIEGADFFPHTAAKDIGHKAIACSLSDIAAMGGKPKYALISIGFPKKQAKEFISEFYKGALALAGKFKTNIVGGDLSLSEKIIVDVSMIGEVLKKNLTLRSGAKPGDLIFVSGSLGGSLYGRHLKFTPRIKEANYLVSNYRISAMMDISDGLSLDLHRLALAGKVGAIIHEELIPVSREAKSLTEALNMGEDYELLFTAQPEEAKRLIKNNPFFKIIGEIR